MFPGFMFDLWHGRSGEALMPGKRVPAETRLRVARQVLDGAATAERAAAVLGVTAQSVYGWVRRLRDSGTEALKDQPTPGRPPKVSDGQAADLYARIVDHSPRDWGIDADLWSRKVVKLLIQREYGVDLASPNVGNLLKAMGLTAQRPLHRAYEQKPELVEEWKKTTLPSIQDQARREGASIFYGDEAAVRSDYHAGSSWAPMGRTPVVRTTGQRFSVNMISAVNGLGMSFFAIFDGHCSTATFTDFCDKLLAEVGHPVFLIVDNAAWHRSKALQEYLETKRGKFRLFRLPPYSPELNPDELVWRDIKAGDIGRTSTANQAEMESRIFARAQRLREFPQIVRNYFKAVGLEALTI
jgi:transposase